MAHLHEKRGRRWLTRLAVAVGALLLGAGIAVGYSVHRFDPAAITIGQVTITRRDYADPGKRALLHMHEDIHQHQFRRVGMLRYLAVYAFDRDQRLRWEAEARLGRLCRLRARNRWKVPEAMELLSRGLQGYSVVRPIPMAEARAHMEEAYRGGQGCSAPVVAGLVARSLRADRNGQHGHSRGVSE